MTPWPLSALVTSPPLEFGPAVRRLAELGFTHADVVALADRPAEHLDALAEAGLVVAGAALGRGLPEGHTLDAPDVGVRRATLRLLERQVDDAARLGATCAYLPDLPEGADEPAATCFTEGCTLLAEHAAGRMVRLAVEPVPGRAGPTPAWLEEGPHPNLGLLLDAGGCLALGEDPAAAVRRAGARLFLVRTGPLARQQLEALVRALRGVGYRGGWVVEAGPGGGPAALGEARRLLAEGVGAG